MRINGLTMRFIMLLLPSILLVAGTPISKLCGVDQYYDEDRGDCLSCYRLCDPINSALETCQRKCLVTYVKIYLLPLQMESMSQNITLGIEKIIENWAEKQEQKNRSFTGKFTAAIFISILNLVGFLFFLTAYLFDKRNIKIDSKRDGDENRLFISDGSAENINTLVGNETTATLTKPMPATADTCSSKHRFYNSDECMKLNQQHPCNE